MSAGRNLSLANPGRVQNKTYYVFQILLCDLGEKHQLLFVLGVLDVAPLLSVSLWHCVEEHPKVSEAFISSVCFIVERRNLNLHL